MDHHALARGEQRRSALGVEVFMPRDRSPRLRTAVRRISTGCPLRPRLIGHKGRIVTDPDVQRGNPHCLAPTDARPRPRDTDRQRSGLRIRTEIRALMPRSRASDPCRNPPEMPEMASLFPAAFQPDSNLGKPKPFQWLAPRPSRPGDIAPFRPEFGPRAGYEDRRRHFRRLCSSSRGRISTKLHGMCR